MSESKMREEFDEWASTHEIRCAWDVWKASRQSPVIAAAPDLMELANRVVEEFNNYERIGEICPFEGQPMIYASVLVELAEFAKIVQAKATA